jgi:hypothetical protein
MNQACHNFLMFCGTKKQWQVVVMLVVVHVVWFYKNEKTMMRSCIVYCCGIVLQVRKKLCSFKHKEDDEQQ